MEPGSTSVQIQPGGRFGDLEIGERLGTGAFSSVYRARDVLLGRDVALKVLNPQSPWGEDATKEQMLDEARMIASLQGAHVVTLYRVHDLADGTWAFEMECMSEGDLTTRLPEGAAFPADETERVIRAVLEALSAAHDQGIIHHDIKPENVLLGSSGEVKLADFGLGRFTREGQLSLGAERRVRGTPPYMAPEVAMGLDATPASDLWSTGVLLYRLLTGRLPFPSHTIESLFFAILNLDPDPIHEDVPLHLAAASLACLKKPPAERPRSAAAILKMLDNPARGTPLPPPVAPRGPTRITGRRRELDTLLTTLAQVDQGQGAAMVIQGMAGIGKSVLLQEFQHRAVERGAHCIQTVVTPLEGLRRPLLRRLRTTLLERVQQHHAAEDVDVNGFESSLIARLEQEEGPSESETSWLTPMLIEQTVKHLAEQAPLVLCIEDLHLCDVEDFRVLTSLGLVCAQHPVVLVATSRSTDSSTLDATQEVSRAYHDLLLHLGVKPLRLEALDHPSIQELLEERFDLAVLPPRIAWRIYEMTEGVPLFAIEVFRHLEDAGEIERDNTTVRTTRRWEQADMAPRLKDLVLGRMRELDEDERVLLETAAVGGQYFQGKWLAHLLDVPLLQVLRSLQRIYRRRALIEAQESGYRFAHALYREALISELAPDLRRALHRGWAELLQSEYESGDVDPEILGWHWEQAGFQQLAAKPLGEAARRAVRRGEQSRAWVLADRAGYLRDDAPPRELQENLGVLLSLAPSYQSPEEVDRVEALYVRLLQAADVLGDKGMRYHTEVKQGWSRFFRSGSAAVDSDVIATASTELTASVAKAEAYWLLSYVHRDAGDLLAASEDLEQAKGIYEQVNRPDQRFSVLTALAQIQRFRGDLVLARALYDDLLESPAWSVGPTAEAVTRTNAILTQAQSGDWEGRADGLARPIRSLESHRQEVRAAQVRVLQAELFEAEGRLDDAAESLARAEPVIEQSAMTEAITTFHLTRARVDVTRGSIDRARAALEAVRQAAGGLKPEHLGTLASREAVLCAATGCEEEARHFLPSVLEACPRVSNQLAVAQYLHEVIFLEGLGVTLPVDDLRGLLEQMRTESLPDALALPVSIASALVRAAKDDDPAEALEHAAGLCRKAHAPWRRAELGILGQLLRARALELGGKRQAANDTRTEAAVAARDMGHVWLELRAARLAEEKPTGWTVRRARVEEMLRDANPGEPDLIDQLTARGILGPSLP